MNYYKDLVDINFFSTEEYEIFYRDFSIKIRNDGPVWETLNAKIENINILKKEYLECLAGKEIDIDLQVRADISHINDLYNLLIIMLCQELYRRGQAEKFYSMSRKLYSNDETKLLSQKLQYAWQALNHITQNKNNPLVVIESECVAYLDSAGEHDLSKHLTNIKVEKPVHDDFIKQNISLNDKNQLIKFYRDTKSYIYELTAANHQVETLFNYTVIIELLKRLGVKKIYDYGSGIGTFLILAKHYGLDGIYSDLKSNTMEFAKWRFKEFGLNIPMIEINPDLISIPNGQDCIVCTEVLEHIINPEELLTAIHLSLNPGGILVVSESFDYVEEFCTHLPQHKGKGGERFIEYLKNQGFKIIDSGLPIHPIICMKN
jgi:2-polyprenyl-3-methyl-5-hydroxy-6-metoxy-1,4-benzoquinol methylase